MARPDPDEITISHGLESWDTAIEAKFGLIFDTPIPLAVYADFASLPDATAYENCLAIAEDTNDLYISDGSDWILVGVNSFLALSDTPSSFSGEGGKRVVVNAGEDALEFEDNHLETLDDVPAIAGEAGKVLTVNGTEDGFEWTAGGGGGGSITLLGRERYTDFSTSEQDTGLVWTDNKKIYEKTVAVTLPNAAASSQLTQTAHGIADISLIVDAFGFAKNAAGEIIPIPYTYSPSTGYGLMLSPSIEHINIRGWGLDYSGYTGYVTIRYLKSAEGPLTTDWPSYDSTEVETGMRHIDGRPIYRKTFSGLAGPSNSETSFAHGISNVKEFVRFEAMAAETGTANLYSHPVPNYSDNNGVYRSMAIWANTTNIYWQTTTTDYSGRKGSSITVWYTKTTDTGATEASLTSKDFSLAEEVNTGNLWIDGKPVFRKTFYLGDMPNAVGTGHLLNIQNLGTVVRMWGVAKRSTYWYATPLFSTLGSYKNLRYYIQPGGLSLGRYTSADMSTFEDEYITIYYTKDQDTSGGGIKFLKESATLNINATTGSASGDGSAAAPFNSFATALAWLADKRIAPSATITLAFAAGTYAFTATVELSHPDQHRIEITGYTTALTARTISAVNTGTKTFTVNGVDCTAEFPANAIAKVYGSTLNDGTFTVVSSTYSGGNTSIVVSETVRNSTADGSIKGYGVVNRILSFTDVGGLKFTRGIKNLNGFIITGNGGGSAQIGVEIKNCISVTMGDNIVIKGFSGDGISISESSNLTTGAIVSTGNAANNLVASGCSSVTINPIGTEGGAFCRSSAGRGIYMTYDSALLALYVIATENYATNLEGFLGALLVANGCRCNFSKTANGIWVRDGCKILVLSTPNCHYNAQYGIRTIHGSFCESALLQARWNTNYGIYTWGASAHSSSSSVLTDNGAGDASPAIGTEGNNNSLNYGS